MAYLNARGAYFPVDGMASSDIKNTCQITASGADRDITGAAIYAVVKDHKKSGTIVGTYTQTITTASTGHFTLVIPKSVMTGKEGEDLSYELYMDLSGTDIPLMHGPINILETY